MSPDETNLPYLTESDIAGALNASTKSVQRHLAECLSAGAIVERYKDDDGAVWGPPDCG